MANVQIGAVRGPCPWALLLCLGWAAWLPAVAAKPAASAHTVQGMVTQVNDGQTLVLTPAGKPAMEVRLRDIEAPEPCQPWALEARQALSTLALNKVASLQTSGRDALGRTVGALMIEELNVGKHLVENGHAWSARTRWDQGPLVKQEKMARALARGLHGTAGALQPVEFRRRFGKCAAPLAESPAVAPAAKTKP